MTDIQHAYWIGRSSGLELGDVACHVYIEWRLQDIDLVRLEAAWNAVIRHHAMMRAVVLADGSQRILAQVPPYRIAVDDLSGVAPQEQAQRLAARRARMANQVLDCNRWPVFELCATRLDVNRVQLHLDLDLLLFDVQSFHILLADLEKLYASPDTALPPFSLTFADVIRERLAARSTGAYGAARDWWLERLPDLPPPPDLPLQTRPAKLGRPAFTRHRRVLPRARWARIQERASQRELTTSAVVLAAFVEVLRRWSRSSRFTLNLTQFDRPRGHPDLARMVGDFTATLLVAADCSGRASFEARAGALQREMWGALARRAFSGIEVMRELARREGGVRGTMMPVVFTSILGLDIDSLADGDRQTSLLGEPVHLHTTTPQIWLDHQAMIRDGALVYNWIVVDGLFPAGMVEEMLESYEMLLDRLATSEAQWTAPVLDLLPRAQAHRRQAVNSTARTFDLQPLHQAVFAATPRSATDPAVIHPATSLSHATLRKYVDSLAAALACQGLRKGDRVAVVLPKDPDQITAVLAVLRQGGVYVPLAADLPDARLAAICRDAGVRLIIGRHERQGWPEGMPVLDPAELETASEAPAAAAVGLRDLAYVIYTSGSTGMPKGVMMSHGAVANTLADINRRHGIGPADRVLALSSLAFDLSVYDVFGVLAAGGTVVLPAEEKRLEPAHWLALMQAHQVTLWNSVPALLAVLLDHVERSGEMVPRSLRRVLLSGDWVPLALPARLRRAAPDAELAVLGGATEAAIWSNQFEVETVDPAWVSIPYGTPLANQRYHVLDDQLEDRPDWVAGHLHIAGAGLAEGYWGDPRRTNAQFIRHPRTGERLYRTGDQARYWPDGLIEFLGRQDGQVKLGGHRIELGEIEACMARQPGIKAAVADVVESAGGGRSLAAWIVLDQDAANGFMAVMVADQSASERWRQATAAAAAAIEAIEPDLAERAARFEMAAEQLAIGAMAWTLDDLGWSSLPIHDPLALLERTGVAPTYHRLIAQWCHALTEHGLLTAEDQGGSWDADRSQAAQAAAEDAALQLRSMAEQLGTGADLVDWVLDSTARMPAILKGEVDPLEILFPEGALDRAEALYRDNPVTAALSRAIGQAIATRAAATPRQRLHILEVGAGTGGTTAHILPHLDPAQTSYTYTDLSDFFFRTARQRLAAPCLSFVRYDVNDPPTAAGLPLHEQDVVVAANVMHDARDIPRSLGHLRDLLRPGGLLLLLEATRNTPLQLVTAGFIEGFNGFADFRAADGLPLLDAARWRQELLRAGFANAESLPTDQDPRGGIFGQHVILARAPDRVRCFDHARFLAALGTFLPDYMLPRSVTLLESLPLSANGKVDRARLPRNSSARGADEAIAATATAMERAVAHVWRDVLEVAEVGRNSHFFRLGGDSLLATRVTGELRARTGRTVPLRMLFERPVLHEFAATLTAASDGPLWPDHLLLRDAGRAAVRTLVLLPGSDGMGQVWRQLAELLPADWTVVALQAPGMGENELPIDDLDTLAAWMADAVAAHVPDGAVLLGGWSFGALLAAEAARHLTTRGASPEALLLIEAPPASVLPAFEPAVVTGAQPATGNGSAAATGGSGAWAQIAANLGLADGEEAEQLGERFTAMVTAHLKALRAHQPRPLAMPVLWAEAAERPAGWAVASAPWPGGLPEGSERLVLPGDHWNLLREGEALRALAATLAEFASH